jgi:4-amino-4-deoxy-L-arabinose transferase-like glycosyltransferase
MFRPGIASPLKLERPAGSQNEARALLALSAAIFIVLTGWNLRLQAISNPDEPRYAVPARLMLRGERGVMVPEYNTAPRIAKPIFFYWLIAATGAVGQVLGVGLEVGLRMGPLLMGLLGVIGIFLIGERLKSARCGFIAALILTTTRFYHDTSRELVVDMTLSAFLLWAALFALMAYQALERQRRATWPLAGAYLCMGLASMTKGPLLPLIFVVLPAFIFLAWRKKLSLLKHAGLPWGVPLALSVGLWWFIWMQSHGFSMTALFMKENVGRTLGQKDHQQHAPYLFYILKLGEFFLPWVIALPFVAVWSWRKWRETRQGGGTAPAPGISWQAQCLLCFLLLPFALLGLSISKRPLYILPMYPWLALWIAWAWDGGVLQREGQSFCAKCANISGAAIAAICFAAIFFTPQLSKFGGLSGEKITCGILLGILGICGFGMMQNLKAGRRFRASVLLLAMACLLALGFESVARPIRERERDSVRFFDQVKTQLAGRPMVMIGETSNEAIWFLDRPNELIDNLRSPDLKPRFFDKPGMVLLAPEKEFKKSPALREAVLLESTIQRGSDTWMLALRNPAREPSPAVFERRTATTDEE